MTTKQHFKNQFYFLYANKHPLDSETNSTVIFNRIKKQRVPEVNLTKKKKKTRPLAGNCEA